MTVVIDDKAFKDLSRIDKKEASRLFEKIEALQDFPDISNIKRLTNHIPRYRYRVGNYRILFDIEGDTLKVYRVLHRKDSYK